MWDSPRGRLLLRVAVLAAYALALSWTLHAGLWRERHSFLHDYDARFWYLGGVSWWRGVSPYDHGPFVALWKETFGEPPVFRSGFVYPPTILPLSLLLGALPWEVARWVMRALSFASLAGCVVLLRRRWVLPLPEGRERALRDLCCAVACAVPAVAQAVHQGQVALVVTFGFLLFWAGLERRRSSWIAVGGVLALIKPQVTLPALVFVSVAKADRRAWIGALAAAVVGAPVLLWSGPSETLRDLGVSLAEHMTQEYNHLQRYDSLAGLFGTTSWGSAATLAGVVAGCAAAAWLGALSRAPSNELRFLRLAQLAVVAGAALMPIHHYDLAIELIVVATAWTLLRPWRVATCVAVLLLHSRGYWLARQLLSRGFADGEWKDVIGPMTAVLGLLVLLLVGWFAWSDRLLRPAEAGRPE